MANFVSAEDMRRIAQYIRSMMDGSGGAVTKGDGIAFTGTAAELEEALKIPDGEEGHIPENALVLITDEEEVLSE